MTGRARPARPIGGPIYLIGFMGVGKTSVGRLLAARMGLPFLDLDQVIVERTGLRIPELFQQRGEDGFRRCEAEALAAVSGRAAVIALGGGAPLLAQNRGRMRETGTVVLLTADVDTLARRLSTPEARGSRPLLQGAAQGTLAARVAELLAQRAEAYASADLVVDTAGREPPHIADEIARRLPVGAGPDTGADRDHHGALFVDLQAGRYPIYIEADDDGAAIAARLCEHLLDALPCLRAGGRLGLVTDQNVARLHLPRYQDALRRRDIDPVVAVIPPGEAHKRLSQVEPVATTLLEGGLDRGGAVLALGGGLVSDLAGFTAATLLRGVPFAVIATTLLAQADAAIGGKTAVNLPLGKNLVGAFHHPRLCAADLFALRTLPAAELASGLGEVLKHALLRGEADLALLEAQAEAARAAAPDVLLPLLRGCAAFKAGVVAADPEERDPKGGRILLNLGHTIGHALETAAAADPQPLRHGEAVGLGLLAMARVSLRLAPGAIDLSPRISALLPRLGLPTDLDARLFAADRALRPAVRAALSLDKKRAGTLVRFVALRRPGEAVILPLRSDALLDALRPGPENSEERS